jgi:hypothetical protein
MAVDALSILALVLMAAGAVLVVVGFVMGGRQERPSEGPRYRVNGTR